MTPNLLPAKPLPRSLRWAILPVFLLLALILGLASAVLPMAYVGAIALLLVCLPVFLIRPAWLIVPVIAAQMYLPSQPVADVVTVIFLTRAALTLIGRWPQLRQHFSAALMRPVYLIVLCALVSLTVAITLLGHGKSPVYQDGRIFVYWFWLIPLLAYAPTERPGQWLAQHLLWVAVIVAALAIFQGVTGISLVATGRIAQLETLGQYTSGITRVQIPGFVFVTFGIFLAGAQLVGGGSGAWRWLYFALLGLFSVALIYNFGRAIWFWTVLGLAITAVLMGWRNALKLGAWAALATVLLGASLTVTKPDLAESIVDRVTSVFQEGGGKTSYGWREVENANARTMLAKTNLLGAGMGGDYRQPVYGLRGFANHTHYIHNGHLSLMLKISVLGYLAYATLFAMLIAAFLKLRKSPAASAFSAAAIAWLLTFAGQNITQPDIMSAHGLTMVVAMLALLLLQRASTLPAVAPAMSKQSRFAMQMTRHLSEQRVGHVGGMPPLSPP